MKTAFLVALTLQICLDRRGFSPNAMDGVVGKKTRDALVAYCQANGYPEPSTMLDAKHVKDFYFPADTDFFVYEIVTKEDLDSIVSIPVKPNEKAALSALGYESIKEMFAERGHITEATLMRLNPDIDWNNVSEGTKIIIPWTDSDSLPALAKCASNDTNSNWRKSKRKAASIRISISGFTVTALDSAGKPMAIFPCSVAKDKAKLPPVGDIRMVTVIKSPNYTYTPDNVPVGSKVARYVFMPGPNNPVGVAWMGLSLPGYGIHGTPYPERIGRAESHGCFRLANWNAERLYELCQPGTKVTIVP